MTIIDKIKRIYQEQKSILDGTSTAVPNTWLIHHSELSSCGTYDYFPTTEWKLGHPRLYLEVLSKAAYKVGLDDLIRSESEIMGHPGEYETEAKDYEI
ncbi:hypothetical protein HN706_02620, partial [Candidatus Woesearchaeota archaeon]|nr:hypothetical protein [Candidatus Woesearchaeota archaeon]MBT7474810.1 hypothetical protein [Candidatus Woesearchaeota archaeon]